MGRLSTARGKAEQSHIEQLLRSIGAKVYHVGTVRRRGDYHGTMQTPGLPDVLAFLPPRRSALWVLLFVESKAGSGRLSPDQRDFRDLCVNAEVHHVTGDLDAVIAWCIDHGYLAREHVPHYRQPPATDYWQACPRADCSDAKACCPDIDGCLVPQSVRRARELSPAEATDAVSAAFQQRMRELKS